jgi:hypothetical protein
MKLHLKEHQPQEMEHRRLLRPTKGLRSQRMAIEFVL